MKKIFDSWSVCDANSTSAIATFDKDFNKQIMIDPATDSRCTRKGTDLNFVSAIGSIVVKKGTKQIWKFKTDIARPIIGIINDAILKSNVNITDHTNTIHKGYGLQLGSWNTFHDTDSGATGHIIQYASQFKAQQPPFNMTMELDMTQAKNKNGILTYIIHNETNKDVKEIRTDDKYTNIAFDNIDINEIVG